MTAGPDEQGELTGTMSTFRILTELAAPVEACFDLSRSIDLHLESMLASDERAVAGVTSGLIGAGEEVTWEARHLCVTWRMTSRIVEFDPPNRFVDEMVRGPFRAFRHEHVFEASGMGTRMVDVITFRTPLAILTERAVGVLPATAHESQERGDPVEGPGCSELRGRSEPDRPTTLAKDCRRMHGHVSA